MTGTVSETPALIAAVVLYLSPESTMRPCMKSSCATSARDNRVTAVIAVATKRLARTDTAVDGGWTDGNGSYQRRLRLSTVKESANAGAINHGNPFPNQVFRCTI